MTCVILASFAAIVGVLSDRQVRGQFLDQMNTSYASLRSYVDPKQVHTRLGTACGGYLPDLAVADNAQIRLFDADGTVDCSSDENANLSPENDPILTPPVGESETGLQTREQGGYEVFEEWIGWGTESHGWLVYARPLSDIEGIVRDYRCLRCCSCSALLRSLL